MITLIERPIADAGLPAARRRQSMRAGVAVVVIAPAAAYLATVDPHAPGGYPTCPVLAVSGFYCPGCGFLRSCYSLLHGDVVGAFARNPLIPLLVVFIGYLLVRWFGATRRGNTLDWLPSRFTPVLLGVAVVLFTVARNLPGWDFLSPA